MPVRLITAPASEPVTLAEAHTALRLEHALDDTYLASLISAARGYVERVCWRGLVSQVWELVAPDFGGEDTLELGYRGRRFMGIVPGLTPAVPGCLPWIELPKGNLLDFLAASLTSVKYIDTLGVEQTVSPSVYTVDFVSVPAKLQLAYGQTWPNTREQWDAVKIRYSVGWSMNAGVWTGPAELKQAILLLVIHLYDKRSLEVVDPGSAFDMLIDPFRLRRL